MERKHHRMNMMINKDFFLKVKGNTLLNNIIFALICPRDLRQALTRLHGHRAQAFLNDQSFCQFNLFCAN